jgi:hypothetical protein
MQFFTVLLILVASISVGQQNWKTLIQEPIALQYQLPNNWYVGGVMQDRTSGEGSYSMNVAPDYAVSMLIKYSDELDLTTLQQQKVWTYSFKPVMAAIEQVKTAHFEFSKVFSTWEEDTDMKVLQFSTTSPQGMNYVIYFWGTMETILENSSLIEQILHSIQTTK